MGTPRCHTRDESVTRRLRLEWAACSLPDTCYVRICLASIHPRLLSGQIERLVALGQELRALGRDVCRAAREVDVVQLNLPTPAFGFVADLVQMLVPVPVVVGYEAQLCDLEEVLRRGHLWRAPAFFAPRVFVNNGLLARMTLRRSRRYV